MRYMKEIVRKIKEFFSLCPDCQRAWDEEKENKCIV